MKAIRSLITQALGKNQNRNKHYTALTELRSYFTTLKTGVRIVDLRHGKLIVGVTELQWMHHVHAIAPLIVAEINKDHRSLGVKSIRVIYSAALPRETTSLHRQKNNSPIRVALTQHERATLSAIKDAELKKFLLKFRSRCKFA